MTNEERFSELVKELWEISPVVRVRSATTKT